MGTQQMVTNKKFTFPHPNNSTLNFPKKNSPLLYPLPQKNLNSLKNQHPFPRKKIVSKAPQSGKIS